MTKEELYDEAVAIFDSGDIDGAIEKMNAVALANPDFVLPHYALSVWYFKRGLTQESLVHALKLPELDKDEPFSYVALSAIAQRAGDTAVAEAALAQGRYM